jgi:hypothetical protein
MNLYGWSLASFKEVLGSKNSALLEDATARLAKALPSEPGLSKAKAWLQTLIERGWPLQEDRAPPTAPSDGGLLTVQLETETHVFAVYCLARAIAQTEHLDLASESSDWQHPSAGALHRDLVACGFTRSRDCCVQYFSWMAKLSNGSPLFGDDFRSDWSIYSLFSNQELAAMIPVFQAAADFQRPLPQGYPEEAAKKMMTCLSEGGKEFIGNLIKWFGRIQQAGQDAFILWW